MTAIDLFDTQTPETNKKIKKLCVYTEFWLMPNGEVKTGVIKRWVSDGKNVTRNTNKAKAMPEVLVGEEVYYD